MRQRCLIQLGKCEWLVVCSLLFKQFYNYKVWVMKSCTLLLLILICLANAQNGFGLAPSSNVASQTTSYTFGVSLYADQSGTGNTFDVEPTTTAAIMLPSQYTGRLATGPYTCTIIDWGDMINPTPAPLCSASGSVITISNLYSTSFTYDFQLDFSINITGIVNPITSGLTGSFFFYFYSPSGPIILTATGIGIAISTMTCSITTTPTIVNSKNGYLIVQFNTPQFQTTSTIGIQFSIYWPEAYGQTQNIISNISSVACSPVTRASASIGCSFAVSGVTQYQGTVSNIVSATVNAASIAFQFGPLTTPPTTRPQGSFILTARNNGILMSQCTSSVSGMTVGSLASASFVASTTTVNTLTQATLQFQVNTNVVSNDTFTVSFPSGISLSSLTLITSPSISPNINNPNTTNNTLTFGGVIIQSNQSVSLTFTNIKNPTSQYPASPFIITTYRNSFQMETFTTLSYSASRATITSQSISAASLQIGVLTTYTIQFTLGQPLSASSSINVGLPTAFQGNVGGCSPSCTYNSTVVSFTSVATTVGSTITLTLTNVKNPSTIGPTTSMTLYTLYNSTQSSSYTEYTNSGLSVTLIARVMPASNVAISSSSQVVSYYPASYSFTITNINPLPANAYLQISIPPQISVITPSQVTCLAGSNSIACSYNQSTRVITLSSFSSAEIGAGQLSASPVTVNGLANPASTSPTSSFGIYLYNALAQTVEYVSSGLTYFVTQAASFYSLNIIPSNTKNSAPTSLLIKFSLTATSYVNSSLLVITFPSVIDLQSVTCSPVSANLLGVSCSVNSNKTQAILTYNSLSTSVSTQFTIATYKNFPSLQPYSLLVDLYQDFFQQSKLCSNSNSPQTLLNTEVGSITLTSFAFATPTLLTTTNLNINIGSASSLAFSYLTVSFPLEFTISGASCSVPSGVTCILNGSSFAINTTTTITLPLIFTINNLVTPSSTNSSPIYIQSYQSYNTRDYTMDSNTNIIFQTACQLPCKTCGPLPNNCGTCYSNASLVQGQIYLNGSLCVSICGNGYYMNSSTNSCVLCTAPCLTCQSSSICYSCTGTYLYNSSCLSTCPFGYYGFDGLCLTCNSAIFCESCPNHHECSTCIVGYYYYNQKCYLACPPLISYQNSVNRTCDLCPTNCTHCQGNSSSVACTVCNSGYVFDTSRCYLSCVTSGLIAVNGICQGCSSLCATCSLLITNCTSCFTNSTAPYLYSSNCLTNCPNGYYASNSTYSCNLCNPPCELCQNISIHSCLSCVQDHYLHQSDCLTACPPTYYNASGICQPCVSPCLECTQQFVCTSCTNGTYLYQNQCLLQCPGGMTVINGNECLVCPSICKTCSSLTFCTSCYISTYLFNGSCLGSCPSTTYANTSTLNCESCVGACGNCSSATYCLSCVDTSKFVVDGACLPCTSPCATCSNTITNCTSCLSNSSKPYYFGLACLTTCPSNYYSNNATYQCSQCATPCLDCSGPSNSSCTSCVGGYYLLLNLCYSVCPATYYPSVNACAACQPPCLTCSALALCLSCTNGSYLYGSTCVANCDPGMTVFNNSVCAYCASSCKTCLSGNSSLCSSCYAGAFLNTNSQTCGSTCLAGFYADSSSGNGLCAGCLAPCDSCSSATYCLSCLDISLFVVNGSCVTCASPCATCSLNYTNCTSCLSNSSKPYYFGLACLTTCPSNYYSNNATYQCSQCVTPCLDCSGPSNSSCTSCVGGYYLLLNLCYSVCPATYYPSVNACAACQPPCLTCSALALCLSCTNGSYLYGSTCVANCDPGMTVFNNSVCAYCASSCKTCLSGNSSLCSSCYAGAFLNTNSQTCGSTCLAGFYADSSSGNGLCAGCLAPCDSCSSATYCLSCLDISLFVVNGSCLACASPCETCSNTITNCTSCLSNSSKPYYFGLACLTTCPSNYYSNNATYQCSQCATPCLDCSGPSNSSCTSCVGGYYLLLNLCYSVCPATYYPSVNACAACQPPCLTCSALALCLSCTNGSYLYGSTCVANCDPGMTVFNNSVCAYCASSCKTCLSGNSSLCSSCYAGAFLNTNSQTCGSTCLAGFYADSSSGNGLCAGCLAPCDSCSSATYCLSCLDTSLFVVNGSCLACASPCATCSLNYTNCTSCLSNSSKPYYFGLACLTTCPSNYYSNNATYQCSQCVTPCLDCSGPSNSSCTSCVGGYYLLLNLCYSVCPATYYPSVNACAACQPPCLTCSALALCLSCTNGSYLYGSTCVANCDPGMTVFNNSVCAYCASSCKTCLSGNSSLCSSCYAGAFLNTNSQTCGSTCLAGFYADSSSGNGLCAGCLAPCDSCSSATYCLSCLDISLFVVNGSCLSCLSPCVTCSTLRSNCTSCNTLLSYRFLYNGTCNANCDFGYYGDASFQCIKCPTPCSSCLNGSSQSCLTCQNGYYQLGSVCYLPCPNTYFSNLTICSSCVSPCLTCSAASTCLSCQNGSYLFGSNCVLSCNLGMAIINGTTCQYCSSSCNTCQSSNSSACTSCLSNTYLYASICLTVCPNGTFANNSSNICQPCIAPCQLCLSVSYCLSCVDNSLYLVGGACVGCSTPCSTCHTTPSTCTSCTVVIGYPYLYNSSCLKDCPGGYYGQLATGQCLACVSPCLTCNSVNSCLGCNGTYLLFQNTCILTCPSGYYSNNVTCLGCSSPCQNCVDNSTCTSCSGGLFLQGPLCVSNCSSGSTPINNTYCQYCSGSCLSCLSSNTSQCTSCYTGLFLLGTTCYASCPNGYFSDSATKKCLPCQNPCDNCTSVSLCLSCLDTSQFLVNYSCVGCISPCLTCSRLRNNCTSCDTNSGFSLLIANQCHSTCPAKTYQSGWQCLPCPLYCDTCLNASSASCQTCMAGYVLYGNTCLLGCPSGYYSNNITCIACNSSCATCSSAAICLSCPATTYLLGSICVSNCSGASVSSNTTNGGVCVFCQSSCNSCLSSNSSYCTSCPNSTYLYQGQCLSNCDLGYFANSVSNSCDACSLPCATCTSPVLCLSCQLSTLFFLINYTCTGCQSPCLSCSDSITLCTSCNNTGSYRYFYQSTCLTTCPPTYYDSASFNCTLCAYPCSTCSGPGNSSCSTCLGGFLQLNNTCYLNCPGGYYNFSNYCISCSSPCLTCFGPGPSACSSCTSGLYLLGSNCVSNCSGMSVSGNTCIYCTSSCLTCLSSNNSYCTSCNGLFLFSGQCVSNCSSGYYQDSTLWICKPCVAPCGNCSSATDCLSCADNTKFLINSVCVACSSPCLTCSSIITNCTSCDSLSGYSILLNNQCLNSCPNTYYLFTATSCASCSLPCNTCFAAGINACQTCVANTYLLNSTCHAVCPSGYFQSVNLCAACTSPCAACQLTTSSCTSCVSGHLLRGSSCVTNCSAGQIVVNGACQVCNTNCLTCLSSNFSYCTSCNSGTYLSSGNCISTCPNLTYANSVLSQCLGCVSPCLSCSTATQCTSCLVSTLFLVNFTCQSCLSPCLTCSGLQTNCTTCDINSTKPYLLYNGCISACPGGFYDGGAYNCLLCVSPCSTCNAGNNRSCLTCISGYSQLGNDCYLICPTTYFSNGTNCLGCNGSLCLSCTITANTCISCATGLYLYGSNCVIGCPIGMIVINGSICQSCQSNCQTCLSSNSSFCTSCFTNSYLFSGICSTSCPIYYFASSGNCIRCQSPCFQCQSITSCLSCSNVLHYLENFTCVSACTYPLIGINSVCYQCSSECLTCTINVTTCLLCANNFYYFPATYSCSLYCSHYVLSKNISSSGNNECTLICPAGTYPDSATKNCKSCPSQCRLCSSSTNCSSCNSGYSYYSYFCYSPCPNVAPYSVNSQCIMCNIVNCQTCLNTTYCQTCSNTTLLISNGNTSSCISSCPSGQMYNSTDLMCVNIPATVPTTNIVSSTIPPYTFLISSASLAFVVFLLKFKYATTNFSLTMFIALNIISSMVIGNILYLELKQSGMADGNFANASISTLIVFSSGCLQVMSSVSTVIAIVAIRNPELIGVWNSHPLIFLTLMALSLVDSNFIFLTTSQLMNFSCFQVKLTSGPIVNAFKFTLISTLFCKALNIGYSAIQLLFYSKNAYRLLSDIIPYRSLAQTASYPIDKSATIQLIVISVLCICFIIYILYKGQQPEDKEDNTKNQSHQSLMEDANAFDKRNNSNAEIVMSIENSDMVVDIDSMKDQKQISLVQNNNLFFEDSGSSLEISGSVRRFKNKKITPDEMLKKMNKQDDNSLQPLQEEQDGQLDVGNDLFFVENQKEINNQGNQNIQGNLGEKLYHPKEEFNMEDQNNSGGIARLVEQNTIDIQDSKIQDLSEILYKQTGAAEEKSNIFGDENEADAEEAAVYQKTMTEVINIKGTENNNPANQQKYSPSQISKYEPNQRIVNEFANSYFDDANKFNQHAFEAKKQQSNEIAFEVVDDDYNELDSIQEISFQKKEDFKQIKPQALSKEEQRLKQDAQIAKILEQSDQNRIFKIEEEESFKEEQPETPVIQSPIENSYFKEEEDLFKPSEGLKGKKNNRANRRRPDIPLPKNQTEKEIMNIYQKKSNEKKEPVMRKKRYPDIPNPSKNSHYVQYQMDDNNFLEEGTFAKPFFSGQIRKDPQSRYNRSRGSQQAPIQEDMPVKPSLQLRKSSFKKVGQMVIQSQNSGRK